MNTLPEGAPTVVYHTCQPTPGRWAIPPLLEGQVHVWFQDLALAASSLEKFTYLLSDDERKRAGRFRFLVDSVEFVVSRATLRLLLAAYQSLQADQLNFLVSEYGRPGLVAQAQDQPIQFNISHSSSLALLAFSRRHRIGIDVERVRHDFEPLDISDKYFSLSERAVLRGLRSELRHEAFFRCWTRKEAFIKAVGEGLSHPLNRFDVSLDPRSEAALLATRPNSREAARWELRDVVVQPGYVAAMAIEIEPAPASGVVTSSLNHQSIRPPQVQSS